jgi:hypothetical protein
MPNNLFNKFGNNQGQNMMKQFEEFKKNFQGDPQAIVQQMLNSGRITQDQLNQLHAMAQQYGLIK